MTFSVILEFKYKENRAVADLGILWAGAIFFALDVV
jgi:hypothetical protein